MLSLFERARPALPLNIWWVDRCAALGIERKRVAHAVSTTSRALARRSADRIAVRLGGGDRADDLALVADLAKRRAGRIHSDTARHAGGKCGRVAEHDEDAPGHVCSHDRRAPRPPRGRRSCASAKRSPAPPRVASPAMAPYSTVLPIMMFSVGSRRRRLWRPISRPPDGPCLHVVGVARIPA